MAGLRAHGFGSIEEARELLGEEAVGKSDAEVMAIHESIARFAQVVVDVYRSRQPLRAVGGGR